MFRGGADLHCHSRHSDGTFPPARLVELAADRGLEAISLTDHDSIEGVEEALEAGRRQGIRVLSGVEVSAEFRGHEIHLLGYGFDPRNPALVASLDGYRKERERRAERMVARLNQLGVPLRLDQVHEAADSATIGRPHLADALVRAGLIPSFQGAFEKYLNPGRPAFVPRARFTLESAREVIGNAGGVLVLAHPHLNLSSDNIRALAELGIDGLECEHPKLKASQTRELLRLAGELGILATGGSDCHGPRRGPVRLGTVRVPLAVVEGMEEIRRIPVERRFPRPDAAQAEGGR